MSSRREHLGISAETLRGWVARAHVDGRAGDLVNRQYSVTAPNQLWVADFTYVRTWAAGLCYVAFVIDAYSRMIVGWKADITMRTLLVSDALEMAVGPRARRRQRPTGLIHHIDADSQYTSIAFTERLAALGIQPSIGTVGDAYDHAMAESPSACTRPS